MLDDIILVNLLFIYVYVNIEVDSNIPPDIVTPCPKRDGSGWST